MKGIENYFPITDVIISTGAGDVTIKKVKIIKI